MEQIAAWTAACRDANGALVERPENRADKKRIHELERELNRKEKALAEAAALLVLRKKPRRFGGTRTHDLALRSPASRDPH